MTMDLTYTPADGGEPRTWNFKPLKMLSPEAEAIEAVGGEMWDTFAQWNTKVAKGHSRAERAAFWILRRREEPRLAFDDVSYEQGEIVIRYDIDERRAFAVGIRANPTISPQERDDFLESLGDLGEEPAPLEQSVSQPEAETTPPSEHSTDGR